MSSTNYKTPRRIAGMKRNNSHSSPFDDLALEYDAWFDREGSLIFFIEAQHMEEAKEGYFPGAGFTIIVAGKRTATTEDVSRNYR